MPSYLIEVDQFDQLALELARRKDPEVVVAVFKSRRPLRGADGSQRC
jgi:hypothetical protein